MRASFAASPEGGSASHGEHCCITAVLRVRRMRTSASRQTRRGYSIRFAAT